MNRRLAMTALSGVLAMTVPTPSTAEPAKAAFQGTAELGCFGCGPRTDGKFSGGYTGTFGTRGYVNWPFNATFSYNEPATGFPGCLVGGTAAGTAKFNDDDVHFTWTRVGPMAAINFTGAINGSGLATFAIEDPVGDPCGVRARVRVAGVLTGE